MTGPSSRAELLKLVGTSFSKLESELDGAGTGIANLDCNNGLTVKDILAIRLWWTDAVLRWVESANELAATELPAPGYSWRDIPDLNRSIARNARQHSYQRTRKHLRLGYDRLLWTIEQLSDDQLLKPGVYPWTGKWPVSRWLSINTARQYDTARSLIRKAVRQHR